MRALAALPVGLLCTLAVVAPSKAAAAQDIFLAIPGLDGESADAQFGGAFEVTSVTGGVTGVSVSASGGGGGGSGKTVFAPLTLKLRSTSAGSLGLEEASASGVHFAQAVVSFRRAGESGAVFLTITLSEVGVASFQREAAAAENAPAETVSLTYTRIQTVYQRLNANGSPGPAVSTCWDVNKNARCAE